MDLTVINGLGPARQEDLEDAGVASIADLVETDVSEIAEASGISESILDGFREQASDLLALQEVEGLTAEDVAILVDADIRSPDALQGADPEELSCETGIATDRIEGWQGSLSAATETTVEDTAREIAEGARETGEIAAKSLDQARVVLQEGINDAKVKFEEDVLTEARILPVKAKEDVDDRLRKLKGDVVILREQADTALVRIGDEVVDGIPIFKAKVEEAGQDLAGGVEEVRVRVQEVRDKRVLPEANKLTEKIKGFFGDS